MMPISGINTGAVQPLAAAEKVPGASKIQKEEEEVRPLKPTMDEYVPEEPREPSGRYWLGKDGDGQPKIHFDDPERTADAPQKPGADVPEEEPDPTDQAVKGPEKKERKEDKVKTAVALAYEAGDAAPKILATGKGELAERIIEKGREGNVPLYKDNKLAKTLSKLEIGDMIPPELYEVVAEILVFVDDMDRLRSKIK